MSLVYVLVVRRPSSDVRLPLSVYHQCVLHVEPSALYLQYVGNQQFTCVIYDATIYHQSELDIPGFYVT